MWAVAARLLRLRRREGPLGFLHRRPGMQVFEPEFRDGHVEALEVCAYTGCVFQRRAGRDARRDELA